jgi:predicted small lipoprotein YifL
MNATFMPGLTPCPGTETTRKRFRAAALAALAAAALALSGCATKGPLHVYALPAGEARAIVDRGETATGTQDSFLAPTDRISGFAYDPFTDHFFLRLDPGNAIRVVDRPARKIKREFDIADAGPGGDLAVRPRDGHLFLIQPGRAELLQTSRLGKVIRTVPVAGAGTRFEGIAYDAVENQLLLLGEDRRRITVHTPEGALVRALRLAEPVGPGLGFDSEQRELYAPLPAGGIGVFGSDGRRLRTLDLPGSFVDVGPRSFVRVF